MKAKFWEEYEHLADDEEEKKEETEAKGETGGGRRSKRRRGSIARKKRLVPREHVNLLKGRWSDDHRPIDENCGCPTCEGG